MQIGLVTVTDHEAMAGLLSNLFTLEFDFATDCAKQLATLHWILDHPAHGHRLVEHFWLGLPPGT